MKDAPPSPPVLSMEDACEALRRGQLILFPTETFYAIGCNSMNPDAVGAVFAAKKRPLSLPLPLVIARREQLDALVTEILPAASLLMDRFWPGPLSLLLPARDTVPELLISPTGELAVRNSSHPAVTALCQTSGFALVASSANVSGNPPVNAPERLDPALTPGIAGVFAAAPPPQGILPSTVADVQNRHDGPVIRILREGALSADALAAVGFPVEIRSSGKASSSRTD